MTDGPNARDAGEHHRRAALRYEGDGSPHDLVFVAAPDDSPKGRGGRAAGVSTVVLALAIVASATIYAAVRVGSPEESVDNVRPRQAGVLAETARFARPAPSRVIPQVGVRRPAALQHPISTVRAPKGVARLVYVPESLSGTVAVIDASSYRIIRRFEVGREPQHVTAALDGRRLYAGAATGDSLTVIDSGSGRPARRIAVRDPHAVYPTPDGSRVIVIAHRERELRFLDAKRWAPLGSVNVPGGGPTHLAFTHDRLFALVTDEPSGRLVKIDVKRMRVAGTLSLGGSPVGVTLSRDGSVFYVANEARGGVSVVHARVLREVGFIPTGAGAHGLSLSRDGRSLYVGNRQAGTISVVDVRKRTVRTWRVGGSPDGLQVSADGSELWISNRFHSSVSVVDTRNGRVLHTIRVNGGPHGLAYR